VVIHDENASGRELWRIYGGGLEAIPQNFGAAIRVPSKTVYLRKIGIGNLPFVALAFQA
jgi:hypothetical protein